MSTFATRLKELRGPESQASFAAALGVNRVQYAKYESGKNKPSVEFLETLCLVHAVSADWVLGLKKNNNEPAVHVMANAGSVVTIGSGAKASVKKSSNSISGECRKCPYKAWGDKFRKAGGTIPGI